MLYSMNVFYKTLYYQTENKFHFIDVTDDVIDFVEESGVSDGLVHVFCPHTTVAVKINEAENGFIMDFRDFMSKLVPENHNYRHNDLSVRNKNTLCEDPSLCINGDSHICQMLIGCSSETIPLRGGELTLGEWQRIFLIEVDKKRKRRLDVSIMTASPVEPEQDKHRNIKENQKGVTENRIASPYFFRSG